MTSPISMHPQVRAALAEGLPVVALETAVVTHGMPKSPLGAESVPSLSDGMRWRADLPANVAVALLLDDAVRHGGAVPAMVAVIDGVLRIGLDHADIARIAEDTAAVKAAARDLPAALALKQSAGTTVSATLAACRQSGALAGAPIRVFATGGIGGAHRGWARSGDVSSDLRAIADTATCVVSSGAKSILDLPATLEMLDTLSVPVIGFGTDHFPRFHSHGDASLSLAQRVDELRDAARICRHHWADLDGGGVLLAVPVPPDAAIDAIEVETAIAVAEERARRAKVRGAAITPFMLDAMAAASGGRLIRANIALLANNATVAARLATHLKTGVAQT